MIANYFGTMVPSYGENKEGDEESKFPRTFNQPPVSNIINSKARSNAMLRSRHVNIVDTLTGKDCKPGCHPGQVFIVFLIQAKAGAGFLICGMHRALSSDSRFTLG